MIYENEKCNEWMCAVNNNVEFDGCNHVYVCDRECEYMRVSAWMIIKEISEEINSDEDDVDSNTSYSC